MSDARIHLISLLGTGAILAGSAWIVVAAVAHAIATRRRWQPRPGRVANLRRRLQGALGPSGLDPTVVIRRADADPLDPIEALIQPVP